MASDLTAAVRDLRAGRLRARDALEVSIAAANAAPAAFVARSDAIARTAADAADHAAATGADAGPLAGLAVSVKDLFDVRGEVTTAGSIVLAADPPAARDAVAVARLRGAGAALLGRTHMSEFAFSGVGLNPHLPLLVNVATARVDGAARVPGGSSSGAAASVAAGAAWAGLGSDTGGSIRVPAALHGLVGFKCTARTVPTEGAFPLSTTLDSVGAITRSVRDAILLHAVLSGADPSVAARPLAALRFAVPTTLLLDDLDADVARAFDRAVAAIAAAGATVETIELRPLETLASLNASGGLTPAEAWALHRRRLATDAARYDPRIVARIRRGESMSAADYIDLRTARRSWIRATEAAIAPFDALLSPTVPMVAPEIAPLQASDDAFFAANARLLRNTAPINFLDGCAISIPCSPGGALPVGLMLWHGALHDGAVLGAALAVEAALAAAAST